MFRRLVHAVRHAIVVIEPEAYPREDIVVEEAMPARVELPLELEDDDEAAEYVQPSSGRRERGRGGGCGSGSGTWSSTGIESVIGNEIERTSDSDWPSKRQEQQRPC